MKESERNSRTDPCAIVTGAAGGIGAAICKRLADAGIAVMGLDMRDPRPAVRLDDFRVTDLAAFVNDESEAGKTVAAISHWLAGRPLNLLINNAATQCLGAVDVLDRSQWRRTLDVNLLAPFFLIQALLPALRSSQGCIVNISSVHAKATKPRFVAYSTSKAALSGMTRALAVEVGNQVAVYGIEPGAVLTDMLREGFAGSSGSIEKLASYHPSGEIADPKQLADFVHFLYTSRIPALQGSAIEFGGGILARLHDPD